MWSVIIDPGNIFARFFCYFVSLGADCKGVMLGRIEVFVGVLWGHYCIRQVSFVKQTFRQ